MNKPTISICTLIRSEAHQMESFLLDLKGFADEVIFVDSGTSTDATIPIIKKHIDTGENHIKHHSFIEEGKPHFGKIRNFCLEKATMDYVIFLDADERLSEDFKNDIRKYLKEKNPNVVKIIRIDDLVTNLVENIDRIIKNDKNIWYGTDEGSRAHEYPIHSDKSEIFPEPIWHSQKEGHWLHSPQRILHCIDLEIYRTPKTKTFFGHLLRGLWLFQFKFKKVYFQQNVRKNGRVGLKYAFMRALQVFIIQLFVGLKPGGKYKYWENPNYEKNMKSALDELHFKNK